MAGTARSPDGLRPCQKEGIAAGARPVAQGVPRRRAARSAVAAERHEPRSLDQLRRISGRAALGAQLRVATTVRATRVERRPAAARRRHPAGNRRVRAPDIAAIHRSKGVRDREGARRAQHPLAHDPRRTLVDSLSARNPAAIGHRSRNRPGRAARPEPRRLTMDPRLLDYYNRELQYFRQMAGEFATQFPKVASRLNMTGIDIADPYVERLLEGVSFLT